MGRFTDFCCQSCLNPANIFTIDFTWCFIIKYKIKTLICIPCLKKTFIMCIIFIIKTYKNFFSAYHVHIVYYT